MDKNLSLSVILPVFNEEGNIEKVIEQARVFLCGCDLFGAHEIIVVNDASNDGTQGLLQKIVDKFPDLKVITHAKNLGYGKALLSGVKIARFPLLFFMDADGQFRVRELEKALCYLEGFDIVMGYRVKRADSFCRTLLARGYGWLVFLFFGLRFKDVNCGFKLFKKYVFEEKNNSTAGVFYTEVLLRAKNRGFKIKEIPVTHLPRLKGKQTGGSLGVIFGAILDLLRLKRDLIREKTKNS